MEYLDGRTLKELLVKNGPTPVPIAIDYARQILGALAFAHRNGIVHRDIKPHNIVVGGDGRLKVTDFGIARSGASQMTEAGSIVGTAQYLSPEQARGAPVDPRSDIYSLGVVLYEMLTGKVPFSGDTPVEIAMKHLSQVPEPPSKLRDGVPHDLDAVVMRALAKDPEQRYATAEEMDADLARVARGVAVVARDRGRDDAGACPAPGISTAQTMIQRPRTNVSPPAPPAYRSPGLLRLRGAAARPLDLAVAARARPDHRRRDRRLVPLHEDPGSAEQQQAGRRARRASAPAGPREAEDHSRPGSARRSSRARATPWRPGQVSTRTRASGTKIGKGSTVDARASRPGSRRCTVPERASARTSPRRSTALAGAGAATPKIVRIYSDQPAGHGDGAAAARGRLGDQGHGRAHQRLARREAGAGAGRDRPAVREREVGARGAGLPVGRDVEIQSDMRAGRRRRRDPQPGTDGRQGDEDHALGLEGPGDDAGAGRDGHEPGRRPSRS